MKQLQILITPNKQLRIKTNTVSTINKKVLRIINQMEQVLEQCEIPGVGLSANQVGVPLRIFIAHLSSKTPPDKTFAASEPTVFINPQITWHSKKLNTDIVPKEELCLEGCLSVPKIYALVKRPWAIKVKYQTIESSKLKVQSSKFEGFNSTLIQHEVDHLNGILFTDHAIKQGTKIYEVGEDKELHLVVL